MHNHKTTEDSLYSMATANGAGMVGKEGIEYSLLHTIQPKQLSLLFPLWSLQMLWKFLYPKAPFQYIT
jgi:hypothetical protein